MPPSSDRSSRLESTAFYILLVTAVLAPLVFWPSQSFALEAVKTVVIALGTVSSAVAFVFLALRERRLSLTPKPMLWIGVVMSISLLASSIGSGYFMKSFFGQGFELGTGSFIMLLMVAGLAAYWAVSRRADRVIVLYAGLIASFILLFVFHAARLFAGAGFASLGILNNVTSTVAGNWYTLAAAAGSIIILALAALLSLPLSAKLKTAYWAVAVLSAAMAFVINSAPVWKALALVFLGLAIYLSIASPRPAGGWLVSFLKRVAWLPLIAAILFGALVYRGNDIAGPAVSKLYSGYSELSLPWQMTLDVAAGELKDHPLLGSGPNRFSQAYLAYKPAGVNPTDAWSVEFNSGFGLIPTFAVTQGLVGTIVWALFFVFFGILGIRSLRGLFGGQSGQISVIAPEQAYARFAVISSYAAASFLWLVAILYVPAHALFFEAFLMTGIWLGASVAYGRLKPFEIAPMPGSRSFRILPVALAVLLALFVLWGLVYLKNAAALAYFSNGVRELTQTDPQTGQSAPDPVAADADFGRALTLNPMDVYWQGKVEATIVEARKIVAAVPANATASTSAQALADAGAAVNRALAYAGNAIAADPSSYYNYVSMAHVAEAAYSLRMPNSYETGVNAYTGAIRQNPQNPSLYVSLARFQANANQLDAAIQTIGASLQVKNNYLDAVFLLSQVEAAKGNLKDAITAAAFAVKLNPQNPLLYFQLGLFQYTAGDYAGAADTLAQSVNLQSDYANAKYFLGLSDARLGRYSEAVAQFEDLLATNPDNAEIKLILANLRAGKSPFSGATAPISTAPEKRATPPLPGNNR